MFLCFDAKQNSNGIYHRKIDTKNLLDRKSWSVFFSDRLKVCCRMENSKIKFGFAQKFRLVSNLSVCEVECGLRSVKVFFT